VCRNGDCEFLRGYEGEKEKLKLDLGHTVGALGKKNSERARKSDNDCIRSRKRLALTLDRPTQPDDSLSGGDPLPLPNPKHRVVDPFESLLRHLD
jgi:hypothetical protein